MYDVHDSSESASQEDILLRTLNIIWLNKGMYLPAITRTRSVAREEKNLSNFLKLAPDKWVENSFEVSAGFLTAGVWWASGQGEHLNSSCIGANIS